MFLPQNSLPESKCRFSMRSVWRFNSNITSFFYFHLSFFPSFVRYKPNQPCGFISRSLNSLFLYQKLSLDYFLSLRRHIQCRSSQLGSRLVHPFKSLTLTRRLLQISALTFHQLPDSELYHSAEPTVHL